MDCRCNKTIHNWEKCYQSLVSLYIYSRKWTTALNPSLALLLPNHVVLGHPLRQICLGNVEWPAGKKGGRDKGEEWGVAERCSLGGHFLAFRRCPSPRLRLGFTWTEGKTERKKLLRRDLASTAAPPSAGGDRPVCKEIGIRSGDANRKEYRNLD